MEHHQKCHFPSRLSSSFLSFFGTSSTGHREGETIPPMIVYGSGQDEEAPVDGDMTGTSERKTLGYPPRRKLKPMARAKSMGTSYRIFAFHSVPMCSGR